MDVNGTDLPDVKTATTSTNASVRLRWDASQKKLYYEYDADGAWGSYVWKTLTSKVLNAGSSNWGMDASSSFIVSLGAVTEDIAITQADNVWLDNFRMTPSIIETYGSTALLGTSQSYYLGSTSTPLISNGQQVSPTSFADKTMVSAEKEGLEYQVLWKTSTGQYMIWHVGLDGVHQATDAVLTTAQVKANEPIFGQDLDGDGLILYAPPPRRCGAGRVPTLFSPD